MPKIPISRIKRIGFDLDGTLYEITPGVEDAMRFESCKAIAKKMKASLAKAKQLFALEYNKSKSSTTVLQKFGVENPSLVSKKAANSPKIIKLLKKNPETVSLLKKLSKKFPLDLVSQNPQRVARARLRKLGLEKFFSIKVISEGGKRDGSAFREWIAKSKCEPSELLYVGNDLERDVETPSKLGINAVHLNQGRNVKARPSYSEIESFGELLELCGVGK